MHFWNHNVIKQMLIYKLKALFTYYQVALMDSQVAYAGSNKVVSKMFLKHADIRDQLSSFGRPMGKPKKVIFKLLKPWFRLEQSAHLISVVFMQHDSNLTGVNSDEIQMDCQSHRFSQQTNGQI